VPGAAIAIEDPLFEGIPRALSLLSTQPLEGELGQHVINTVRRYLVAAGITA
jgi:hypothetical protein